MLTQQGEFDCVTYRDRTGGLHIALTRGKWSAADEVLVRVHEPLSVLDLLDAGPGDHSWPLPRALAALHESERAVAVLLNCGEDAASLLPQVLTRSRGARKPVLPMDLRTYGIGAQILRDLGVGRMKLLGSPRRMPSLPGYGLEVTAFVEDETPVAAVPEPSHAQR
jgi:3,4-dihydroxy 2-butanone 4-phosphate synthase/GTP cyclohydrolase II